MRSLSSTLFSIVLPAMLAGGLVFGSTLGRADSGRTDLAGFWPMGDIVGTRLAERDRLPKPPRPPRPPRAPVAPVAPASDDSDDSDDSDMPTPPTPLMHSHGKHGGGFSVSIHDGKVDISGIDQMVDEQLAQARDSIAHNSNIPPQVRDRVLQHLDRTREKVTRRLRNLKAADTAKIGEEMSKMGEELAHELEGLDGDLQQLDGQLGKDFAKKFDKNWMKNFHVQWDHASDRNDNDTDNDSDASDAADALPPMPDSIDPDDMAAALADLNDLALQTAQRAEIVRVGADAEKQVAAAQQRLAVLSAQLQEKLANPSANEAEVSGYIDQVTAQEATIRKARILGWVKARHVLDDAQRAKVEAVKHKHR